MKRINIVFLFICTFLISFSRSDAMEKNDQQKENYDSPEKIAAVSSQCPEVQKKRSLGALHVHNPPVISRVKRRLCFTQNNNNSETISSSQDAVTIDKWLKEELAKIYTQEEVDFATKQLEKVDLKK